MAFQLAGRQNADGSGCLGQAISTHIRGFEDGLNLQMDLIDSAIVGISNGWTDWDEIFYVYSNGSLDGFKTQLNPVGGAAVGISLKAFPGRTTSAETANIYI
ncbi:hypothetical protein EVAR_21634_1 [Eumeta japonica]|uniref:Uncharacterized protein n=1 Tax=Eumeta variegata TaxID=151549 RepID=A0A4C1UYU4_EUMVA|nr:hypothetical protein EVAR_21634_1 [Eumeta japonica]